jgi:hypothetical protein
MVLTEIRPPLDGPGGKDVTENDLEEWWADILPPPLNPPHYPVTGLVFGHLWMGLLYGERELTDANYQRQRVVIPSGSTMEFRAEFPQGIAGDVTAAALYLRERGGELLWKKEYPILCLSPGVQLSISLVLQDVEGDAGQFVGFRKILKLHGVL